MLHYDPRHVSSNTVLILRRSNCIFTASGIVTIFMRPYNAPIESGLQSALNRHRLLKLTVHFYLVPSLKYTGVCYMV